jgi:hypothetical protein
MLKRIFYTITNLTSLGIIFNVVYNIDITENFYIIVCLCILILEKGISYNDK